MIPKFRAWDRIEKVMHYNVQDVYDGMCSTVQACCFGQFLEEEMKDKDIVIGKVNVEEERGLALELRVMSIPTLIFFQDGKEIRRAVWLRSKEELLELLQ